MIKVLIADDHALVREGIRMILASHDDIEVVGEAGNGSEAVEKSHSLCPDVILMDIAMPGLGGLEATTEIRKTSPTSKVLVLTQYDNQEYIYRFLRAGASGYMLKKAVGKDLVSAIRAVHAGGFFLDPSIAGTVVESYLGAMDEKKPEDTYARLTDREKQVLKLVAEGYTTKEIANALTLSVKTVMAHRSNIMEKLGLHSRTELIKYAIREGLITVQP